MIKANLAARMGQLSADRVPFVVATVVRARKPTSVRPGDAALVTADGTISGFVGGQCAESSVRLYALRALETGEPLLLRLIPGDEPGDTGSDGIDGAVVERNPCLSGGALEIFLEPQLPAARLVIVGGSPIAIALEEAANAAGYDVMRGPAAQDHTPKGAAAVVLASHGHEEERILSAALRAGVPYVALVASRVRGEAVRAALDVPAALAAQLHTPAGLDIGARTPAEIAISILAEMIARHHADPRHHAAGRAEAGPGAEAEPEPGVQAPVGSDRRGVAEAIDPVCGMTVAVTATTPSLDAGGERAYFCGSGCRDAYAARIAARGPES
jgi:xanthine dehydrogenase accessory factor